MHLPSLVCSDWDMYSRVGARRFWRVCDGTTGQKISEIGQSLLIERIRWSVLHLFHPSTN